MDNAILLRKPPSAVRRSAWAILAAILILTLTLGAASNAQAAAPAAAARLVIPALGLDAPIVHTPIVNRQWNVGMLGASMVGHLERTAWVGEGSNIVLAGHSEMAVNAYDGVFASLNRLSPGDEIRITQGGAAWQYVVSEVRTVSYRDVSIVFPTRHEQLTLFTCALGTYDRNLGKYRQRLVVVALPAP